MFCEKCGAKNEGSAIFCENCGNRLITEKTAKSENHTAPNLNESPKNTIEKKPMSLKNKIILIAVLVLAVVLVGGYNLGKHLADPKLIVEKYVDNLILKDYNAIYDSMDFEANEFTKKETFINLMKNSEENLKISNYTVTEELSEDPQIKTYKVSYFEKEMNDSEALYVTLVKQAEKKYFIFDNYKVSVKELLAKNFSVTVPEEATIYIDQTKVNEKYVVKDENPDTGLKKYVIPSMFEGSYTVKIAMPLCEEKIFENYCISSTADPIEFDEFYLSEDGTTQIEQFADKFMRELYNSVTNRSTAGLTDYIYPEYKNDFQNWFNESTSNLEPGESPPQYVVNNILCSIIDPCYDYKSKKIITYVESDLDMTVFFGGEAQHVDGNGIYHIEFINENGNFFVRSMY